MIVSALFGIPAVRRSNNDVLEQIFEVSSFFLAPKKPRWWKKLYETA